MASFMLHGKNGIGVRYNFENGSSLTNTPAKCVLENEYAQELLESSDLFLGGRVRLDKVINDDPKKAVVNVEGVTNLSGAINYIKERYGKQVVNAAGVKKFAKDNNINFVDMAKKEE